jgi:hypothetical protein
VVDEVEGYFVQGIDLKKVLLVTMKMNMPNC